MKKIIITAAVIAAGASAASAQSSVTISGIADAGLVRTDTFDGTHATRLSNGFKSSRLRFSGTEDMGGGLRANFTFESGIAVDTGAVSNFGQFHRQSHVGLSHRDWGTLRFGKSLVPSARAVCLFADLHDCGGGFNNSGLFYNGTNGFGRWVSVKPGRGGNNNASMSSFSGGGSGAANSSDSGRIANAIFYDSPVFGGGFQAHLAYGLGEVPSSNPNGDGDHTSAGLSYRKGSINVSLNYEHTERDPLWNAEGKMWTIGGLYASGPLRIGAVYQTETANGPAALWTKASAWALTAAYAMGNFEPYVKVGAHRTNGTGAYGIVNARDVQMFELGTVYSLSKRTSLYAEFATDMRGGDAPGANRKNPRQLMAGITHTF